MQRRRKGLGGRQRGLRRRKIRPVLAVSGAEEDGNGFPMDRGRSGTATEELRGHEEDAGRHKDGRGDLGTWRPW